MDSDDAALTDAALLTAFDTQVRRALRAGPGMRIVLLEDPAPMLLLLPGSQASWGGGVMWSDLTEANADAAVAAAIEAVAAAAVEHDLQPKEWEWKHYAYDQPADLTTRLRAAGFEPEDDEALVVGEVDVIRRRLVRTPHPEGITIRRILDHAQGRAQDWRAIAELDEAVWGEDGTERCESLAAALDSDPEAMTVWLAVAADGTVVCAARIEFHPGTDFASLWGGETLEAYRGQGIYKTLVSRRADEAAERGFRFLQVDASPDSRPILERLGLRTLTTTTPWTWTPTP